MAIRSINPWLVVLGSACALTVGNGPVMQFTFGVFLKPLMEEFHTSRGLTSFALTIGVTFTALFLPAAGRLADRIGPRSVGLAAVCAMTLGLLFVALLARSIWAFIILFALVGAAASGQTPLPYTKAVTACFDRSRGLALALTLTGVGIGSILLPLVAQALVGSFGWRGGYVGIACLLCLISIPALLIFIPNNQGSISKLSGAIPAPGMTPAEAIRTRSFWLLLLGLFFGAAAANGTIAHIVPMLTDRGTPAAVAAGALAWVGVAAIAGRVIGGVLLDRMWAPLVALIFLLGMAAGIGVLILASSPAAASWAVLLIGLGLGVEADLVGFMLSRYLGLRAYGVLFGWAFGVFVLASSLGPVLMGILFDVTGSYSSCLVIFICFTLAAAGAFLLMGRYKYPVAAAAVRSAH